MAQTPRRKNVCDVRRITVVVADDCFAWGPPHDQTSRALNSLSLSREGTTRVVAGLVMHLEPPPQLQVTSMSGHGTPSPGEESAEQHGVSCALVQGAAAWGTCDPQRERQPVQSPFCTDRYLTPRAPALSVLSREGKASGLVVGTSFPNGAIDRKSVV